MNLDFVKLTITLKVLAMAVSVLLSQGLGEDTPDSTKVWKRMEIRKEKGRKLIHSVERSTFSGAH